jgi:hypothetical protein
LLEAAHVSAVAIAELGPVRIKPAGDRVERLVHDASSDGDRGRTVVCDGERERRCRRATRHGEYEH